MLHLLTGLHVLDHFIEATKRRVRPTQALLEWRLRRLEREKGVLNN
jgi:hypothetical protein